MHSPFGGLRKRLIRADVGCVGAVLFVVVISGAVLGLIAMVWWGLRAYL